MLETTKLQRLIEVNNLISQLEDEKKVLSSLIIDDITEKVSVNGYTVSKITSNRTILKKGVELSQLVEKLGGGAIKQEANMEYLKETPEAFEFLELKESSYLKITKDQEPLPTDPA